MDRNELFSWMGRYGSTGNAAMLAEVYKEMQSILKDWKCSRPAFKNIVGQLWTIWPKFSRYYDLTVTISEEKLEEMRVMQRGSGLKVPALADYNNARLAFRKAWAVAVKEGRNEARRG